MSKSVAIMQPTYLPWIGYFDLIDRVDTFVFSNVEFAHRSWQHRNRILTSNGSAWMTVPVAVKGHRNQLIRDVAISEEHPWRKKHLGMLRCNYGKAPHFARYREAICAAYERPWLGLCDLNISLIKTLSGILGIEATFVNASELDSTAHRVLRLIDLCKELGGTQYVSPVGSSGYIEDDNRFPEADITLVYQHFQHPTYRQPGSEFVSHLSLVDLLFNEGDESLNIIRSGQRPFFSSDEVRSMLAGK